MQPLRILILSDGRAGHFNLSEGIAAALAKRVPTRVERRDVRRGRWPGPVLAAMTRVWAPSEPLMRLVYDIDATALAPADVVISAGAETLAASIWIARTLGCPNIFYGSLRWFAPTDFALVLTSYARKAGRPRHALALKPSPLDPDTFRPATTSVRPRPGNPPRRVALLVGGNAGTVHYADADWDRLLAFMPRATAELATRWLVTNSRRTPDAVSDRLAALARARPDCVDTFVDVRSAGAGTLKGILAAADAVICTDDSSSMISECVWCRLPVIGVRPARCHLPADEAAYRAWLARSRWCASLPFDGLEPQVMLAALAGLEPAAGNPLDALAALLEQRLPHLQPSQRRA